jgi:hypothetical protein
VGRSDRFGEPNMARYARRAGFPERRARGNAGGAHDAEDRRRDCREYFIAVVVPPSRRAPHAVLGRKGSGRIPLHYPVRRGQDNPCLSEHEVAERYRRRLSWQEDEERRVRRVVNEGRSALRRGTGSWLFVAVIPESPAEGVLDRSTAKEIEDWYRSGRGRSPLRDLFPAHGRAIPAPGRLTFTGSARTDADDETNVRDGYVALYVDGTVFAATPLKGRQADEEFGSVQDLDLVDDAIALADLALEWCPRRAGSYGTATAVIGFADAASPDLTGTIEGRPVVLFNSSTVSPGRIPRTRPVPVTAEAKTVVDLASVGGNQDRMIVTYWLLRGILQWFGIAEPRQVTHYGALVLPAFSHSMRRQVEVWAQRLGVQVLHRFEE